MTRYSARQVPQCVGLALRLLPLPSERHHDQKSGNESSAGELRGVDANAGAFLPERGFVMRNRIDIDSKHSRAIVQEIGERLRAFLQEEPEPPESLRTQIDRLRELEEQSPSIIPADERWDKRRH